MHAQRKRPPLWSEAETQLFLVIMKDLDINRILEMHKHRNHNLFVKLVEGMKEGGSVRTVQQVLHWWKTCFAQM